MPATKLKIKICRNVSEAPVYRPPEFKNAELVEAVIVRNGTVKQRSTVDFIFVDQSGQKHVAMITARLITTLSTAIGEPP